MFAGKVQAVLRGAEWCHQNRHRTRIEANLAAAVCLFTADPDLTIASWFSYASRSNGAHLMLDLVSRALV